MSLDGSLRRSVPASRRVVQAAGAPGGLDHSAVPSVISAWPRALRRDKYARVAAKPCGAFANRAGAAGVVGTEITIDQGVASWAMELFLAAVTNGATVGMALRQARWAMLRRGNLMGFAYTPYCLASLTLRQSSDPPGKAA
jgi:hypothetical protein